MPHWSPDLAPDQQRVADLILTSLRPKKWPGRTRRHNRQRRRTSVAVLSGLNPPGRAFGPIGKYRYLLVLCVGRLDFG